MNEKKIFRNNLIAVIILILYWLGLYGRAVVKHTLQFRGQMLATDYLSIVASLGLLILLLLLFGRKWSEESLVDRFARHPYRSLAFLVVLTCSFVFYYFITGTHFFVYEDIGTDLRDDYIPIISMIVNKIKDHDFSFWTSNWGMGIDILNAQSTVCDIFNIPVYIVGVLANLECAIFVLPFMHMLKCYLCGLFTYKYLDQFSMSSRSKVIAAYLSSFSGFIMLWGQHYFFASVCVWMMLIFWQIECYLHGKRNQLGLTISVAIIALTSLYMTYMVGLAAAIYTIFRLVYLLRKDNVGEVLLTAAKMILCVLTGILLSAIITLPVYYQLTYVSSRLDESSSVLDTIKKYLTAFYDWEEVKGIIFRFFSNNMTGVGSYYLGEYNYFEQAQYYFSFMGVIFLIMYYAERIIRGKKKPMHVLAFLMTLYTIFMPMTAEIFNRFVNNSFRYTLVLIPMFAYAVAYIMTDLKKLHPVTMGVGWVASLASVGFVVVYGLKNEKNLVYSYATMALLIMSLVLLTIARFSVKLERVAVLAFCLLLAGHVAIESYNTVDGYVTSYDANGKILTDNQRSALTRANWLAKQGLGKNTEAALAELNRSDNDADRVEMAYVDFSRWNDSMIHDFDGYSYYNTSYNQYAEYFVRHVWPEGSIFPGYASFLLDADNAQMASLLDIEYVICDKDEMAGVEGYQLVVDNDAYQVYENTNASGLGIMFDQAVSWASMDALSVDEKKEVMANAVVLGEGTDASQIQKTDDWASYYKENGVEFVKGNSDGEYSATVTANHERYLMVSIPYDEGWTAKIDGQEVSKLTADYGFIGLIIEPGQHDIELTYKTPWMNYGMMGSIAGLILLLLETIIFAVIDRKKKDRQKIR